MLGHSANGEGEYQVRLEFDRLRVDFLLTGVKLGYYRGVQMVLIYRIYPVAQSVGVHHVHQIRNGAKQHVFLDQRPDLLMKLH